uniref:DUF4328 domain-containing protein n=1 Tax=Parerythrobacter lutipelagi TaxID=1964208 RepID=UPI0010F75C4E|nr:DUF4328 domain-containing protein [Parerythrobacter lutipelagi]
MNSELEQGLDTLDQRATLARIAIIIVIATSLLSLAAVVLLLNGVIDQVNPYSDELHPVDFVVLLDFLALVVSFVLVGMWIHRGHKNLIAADLPSLKYTPGWAIGWFAIPFANLFKPFQAMRELWNASHGAIGDYSDEVPGFFWVWWLAYVFSGLGGFGEEYSMIDVIGYALTIMSAAALLHIVNSVTRAQRSMNLADTFA